MRADASNRAVTGTSRAVWLLALAVAGLPVVFGLYQVSIHFDEAFPHIYWSRTLPAFVVVALVFVGLAAPISVIVTRHRFLSWPGSRQWRAVAVLLLVMLFAYLVPFVVLAKEARRSRAILPYTPSVYLIHSNGDDGTPFQFGFAGGPGTGEGSRRGHDDRTIVTWTAWLEPRHLARGAVPEPVVHLRAEASSETRPAVIDVQIETGRTVRFDTRGFDILAVSKDGKTVELPIEISAGLHQFIIEASP